MIKPIYSFTLFRQYLMMGNLGYFTRISFPFFFYHVLIMVSLQNTYVNLFFPKAGSLEAWIKMREVWLKDAVRSDDLVIAARRTS